MLAMIGACEKLRLHLCHPWSEWLMVTGADARPLLAQTPS
jgi:hypothetical protein